jgi:hypothetical protein
MSATMEKLEQFLKSMGLKYRVFSAEDRIVLPYNINSRQFLVVIDRSDRWIRMSTRILSADQAKTANQLALQRELLVANGNLAEVKYFMTEEGDVGVVGHEGTDALTIDGFREEYEALPFAIQYFLDKIAPKLNIQVPGIK